MLRIADLRVSVSTRRGRLDAVRGLDLTIGPGETVGLVGESGCGKSLTCLAAIGLLPPNAAASGMVDYDGTDVLAAPATRLETLRGRRIGMIFQDAVAALNPIRTVGAQLSEVLSLHRGLASAAARSEAVRLMHDVGIADPEARAGAYPHQLSGGMNQRVMIALALAGRPDLLIADEPTTALDTTTQAQILTLLRRVREETGSALLLVTHDLGVVHETCARIAVMYAGRIVESGPTAAVLATPRHPYTAALVASLPRLGGRDGRLAAIAGSVPPLHAIPAGCAFAPRCPRADDACGRTDPVALDNGDGRTVACLRPLPADRPRLAAVAEPGAGPEEATTAPGPAVVEVREVVCTFPVRTAFWRPRRRIAAVDRVSLTVTAGETLGLIGESGCGKSTLGRALMGLLRPDAGAVAVEGKDRWSVGARPAPEAMQLVFQDSLGALDPRMRAGAQVEEPLVVAGVPAAERRARTLRILDAVGLGPDHAERFPHQLSGGQRQRVVIARALVLDPRILVLDEPIASLDLSIQAQIVNLLLDLRATRGLAYVFISHDIRVVRLVSHRVAVMYLGRFVETGPAADVLDAPLHPYTRMLRGAVPRLDAAETIEGRLVPVGDPPSLLDPPSGCTFHPRCPLAVDVCRSVAPPPVPRAGGGAVACHRLVA